MVNKKPVKYWTFESSSGSKTYQTILYEDSTTSCDCMGWTRRVASDGTRSCKHTRSIDMGRADIECLTYSSPKNIITERPIKIQVTEEAPRKVSWK